MKGLIKFLRLEGWTSFFTAVALLAGCANAPDITSTERSADQPYSAADVRQITLDHPQFISGDYFRKREENPTKIIGESSSTSEQEKAKPVTNVAPAVAAPVADDGNRPMKIKTALLVDQSRVPDDKALLLTDSADKISVNFPIVLLSSMEIEKSVSRLKEIDPNDLTSVSKTLAVYPGVRMLVLIDTFELPQTYPGTARTLINLVDAGVLHRYPPLEVTLTLANEADASFFAETVVGTIFDQIVAQSTLTPWFCRAFSQEGQTWYINAGKASGLEPGELLKVVAGGKLVKAPSGAPAGWIPGEIKGSLRVDQHFGRDLAAGSLVDGLGPGDGDLLMK